MVKVSTLVRTAICALALVGASAFAQTPAKDALKSINDLRVAKFADARQSGKPIDFAAIDREVKAKAEEAIKGIEPSKVLANEAYDWAQLFSLAGRHKDVCDLCHMYVKSNPTPEMKFTAQMLMMNSCNALGEADMLILTLKDIKPVNAMMGRSLASSTAYTFADTIVKSQGIPAALSVIDGIMAKLPEEDHKANAQRMLDAAKAREAQNPPANAPKPDAERLVEFEASSISQAQSVRFTLVEKKAELLKESGKKSDALKVLKDFVGSVDAKSPVARTANAGIKQMEMIGMVAPALNSERSHGTFNGLGSLKGKVVIIDFFAHWCGPCKASYPDMRKMYDELNGKGLEIVGVTTYYGYYGKENAAKRDMPKDTEFAKMADFIKEFNIAWPVVYGERSNFEAYGVTGIPHVTVLDRKGNVHSIEIGYSPELFKKFRAEIDKLINEK